MGGKQAVIPGINAPSTDVLLVSVRNLRTWVACDTRLNLPHFLGSPVIVLKLILS